MRYLSLCSGIEAASVAWMPLGWQAVAFAEIEPFPCAVLAHHYPSVPNLGDISKFDGRQFRGAVDIIIGGTPCQDFSIAGKRAGLDGERSGLAREFIRLLSEVRPAWFIWENVPGVFSTGGGADFRAILTAFDDCGYSCAWRVLDAQFFGVPQRRRRVFVVGHLGGWQFAAKVLFERESVRRNTAPGGKKRQNIANCLKGGSGERGWDLSAEGNYLSVADTLCAQAGPSGYGGEVGFKNFIPAPYKKTSASQYGDNAGTLTARADSSPCANRGPTILAVRTAQTSSNGNGIAENVSHTLDCANGQAVLSYVPPIVQQAMSCKWAKGSSGPAGDEHHNLIAIQPNKIVGTLYGSGAGTERTSGQPCESDMLVLATQQGVAELCKDISPAITAAAGESGNNQPVLFHKPAMQVRRLTPKECERLQGFPDEYTNVLFRGKPAPDSPRYKALGNSMATPVIRWLGERIARAQRGT